MISRFINANARAPSAIRNRSTWMINIGTHKKPYSDREWDYLRESLRDAIERVLHDENVSSNLFFPVRRDDTTGKMVRDDANLFRRNPAYLGINGRPVADFVIERGSKQGRVDAHILIEVVHSNTFIQFDVAAMADLLGIELQLENVSFAAAPILSDDPKKPNQPIQWADGKLYVTYTSIGKTHASNAHVYLLKQTDNQSVEAADLMMDRVRTEADILAGAGYITQRQSIFTVLPPVY